MNTHYNHDLAAWAAHQADLLKAGRLQELDIKNLIEKMEAMNRKEHRGLLRRLAILIAHLLKWNTSQPIAATVGAEPLLTSVRKLATCWKIRPV